MRNGFSTLELVVVVAIALILAGIAIPNIMAALASLQLSSSTATAAGLLQEMRLRAVSDDRHYTMMAVATAGAMLLYADLNSNGVFDAGEPAVQVAAGVVPAATNNPAITTMSLDFTPQPAGTPVSVSARGVPCVVSGASCKTTWNGNIVGFAYFFSSQVRGSRAWTAITFSPSGRIKTWTWNGASWKQR